MFILTYNIKFKELDSKIELLNINDIYNVFYDSPLEITTDEYGYGYLEKEVSDIDIKVAYDEDKSSLNNFIDKVSSILDSNCISIEEINYDYEEYDFPDVHINDEWMLSSSTDNDEKKGKNVITFCPQGAFGTGLHETTQDLLNVILSKIDLHNKTVMDIGTGSGILSIASSIVGASKVTAIDIRDVRNEVIFNAKLNGLYNIEVLIGNALDGEVNINDKFHWIFINIGGEETELFMDFIKEHLEEGGNLLVSGLVEWSFNKVKEIVEQHGFSLQQKYQSNEWITAIFE
ncbi:MAG: 50S ribosomal protein L11 methyltransferase [Clostridium sp.]|uniref:50S ribosomal protein L11 methyltransferase n=1 Tax=Clostridium sp. TaxID=1506 RepID=UPI00290E8EB1|nr:50S ribosomal protein L11 methyltransferase [Clostridium sp.]MDU5109275.1 50S ribosomal protein L11 methyltransferase [Clostridium sp.]